MINTKNFRPYKRKDLASSVKDVDTKKRIVTGYYSDFNSKDSYREIVAPGAFKKSISERGPMSKNRIYHLMYHNWYMPINKPQILAEDSKGLYFETYFPDTTQGNDALKMYEAGAFNEHSIGYEELDVKKEGEVVILKELYLYEGSTVLLGANENTPFTGIKSLDELQKYNDKYDILQKLLRNSDISDESLMFIENTIKQLFTEIQEFKNSLIEIEGPGDHSKNEDKPDGERLLLKLELWDKLTSY